MTPPPAAPEPDRAAPQATIAVRVQPRARKDEIAAVRNGVLIVRLTTPPLDGRANAALCKLLAARLGVRSSATSIVRGQHAREKTVRIEGVSQQRAETLLDLGRSAG
jgi:uncharacterized protein (TIGR00251 family)